MTIVYLKVFEEASAKGDTYSFEIEDFELSDYHFKKMVCILSEYDAFPKAKAWFRKTFPNDTKKTVGLIIFYQVVIDWMPLVVLHFMGETTFKELAKRVDMKEDTLYRRMISYEEDFGLVKVDRSHQPHKISLDRMEIRFASELMEENLEDWKKYKKEYREKMLFNKKIEKEFIKKQRMAE